METARLMEIASKYFRCNQSNFTDGHRFKYSTPYFSVEISHEEDGYLGLILNGPNVIYSIKNKDFGAACLSIHCHLKDMKMFIIKMLTTYNSPINSVMSLDGWTDF